MVGELLMRVSLPLIVLFSAFSSAPTRADADWLASAFPERSFQFGNVARGSQLRHAFLVVNRTSSDIRIADWKTKCGCTNVKVGARLIPPGTQTTVEATIDTTKFQGDKASGLILVLDRPVYAEVHLNVTCYIRGDITLTPGQLDFGAVRRSEKLPSTSLTLSYGGGRADWAIAEMKTQTAKVKAEARSLNRTADGQTQWLITATLQPGISSGSFKDEVTVITNDSPPQTIPISIVANIRSAVTALPSVINFGPLRAGQSATKVIHLRSSSPFAITKLGADRSELEVVDQESSAAAPDHEVRVTIKAPVAPGPFFGMVTIESDVKDEPPAQIKTFATTVAGS
jgi:Protein of unknown function (DUF1573)